MDTWAKSGPRQFSEDAMQVARTVVTRYLTLLRETPPGSDIFDELELPVDRKTMIQAFRLLIAAETNPKVRAQLVTVGLTLAQFQMDIGERLRLEAVDVPPGQSAGDRDPSFEVIRKIERALSAVEPERARLKRLFDEASKFSSVRRRARPAYSPGADAYQRF